MAFGIPSSQDLSGLVTQLQGLVTGAETQEQQIISGAITQLGAHADALADREAQIVKAAEDPVIDRLDKVIAIVSAGFEGTVGGIPFTLRAAQAKT